MSLRFIAYSYLKFFIDYLGFLKDTMNLGSRLLFCSRLRFAAYLFLSFVLDLDFPACPNKCCYPLYM
jgi:hypothetical protein